MVACQMRSTVEFGAAREGDKEGTRTADGIEDSGLDHDRTDET